MQAISGMPGTGSLLTTPADTLGAVTPAITLVGDSTLTYPDPREQAPFEVGDFIIWSGTLVNTGNPTTDIIWVHTIDANVGIFTQPGTLPAYIAIGDNGIGVNPEPKAAVALVGVEATARLFMEASTSDIASVVDIYLDDKGFSLPAGSSPAGPLVPNAAGTPPTEYFRWITPESMTGAVADQAVQTGKGTFIPSTSVAQANAFGGGIYTQFIGPQPGRARIRANAVPAIDASLACTVTNATVGGTRGCAVTQSPTRYIRAVLRSLCAPAATGTASEVAPPNALAAVPATNLDTGAAGALVNSGTYFDINASRAVLPGAAGANYTGTGSGVVARQAGDACLESAQYANGLFTGQSMAPVGEYIFPENTLAGFRVVPNNFWHMGFMAYGENGRDGNSTRAIGAADGNRPW